MKRLLLLAAAATAGVLAGLVRRRPVRRPVAGVELRSPSTSG
jgi:hypothetical protein